MAEQPKQLATLDPIEYELKQKIEEQKMAKFDDGDPLYEQLGFKSNLKYQARFEVRVACQKFLRLSFLYDFIALESLSQIYLETIHECITKLNLQTN